ncbi:RraA family protein [Kribbella sp. NPDC056345]|uniref:RraA family protein n=1 Tax=Kribbella sp. NPDC056345 TaxID=3345789 RepID=UPI0035E0A530
MLERFKDFSTANVADACQRLGVPVRAVSLKAAVGERVAGRVLPVQHSGSLDVVFEAISSANPGDVIVIDNGGRRDEGCFGDLLAIEAAFAQVSGAVIWGVHRDTAGLRKVGLPVFSLGEVPTYPWRHGPAPADAFSTATVGEWQVTREDVVLGDEDGVLFIPGDRVDELFALAEAIKKNEDRQIDAVRAGHSLREQMKFEEYLKLRAADPSLTLPGYLHSLAAAAKE